LSAHPSGQCCKLFYEPGLAYPWFTNDKCKLGPSGVCRFKELTQRTELHFSADELVACGIGEDSGSILGVDSLMQIEAIASATMGND